MTRFYAIRPILMAAFLVAAGVHMEAGGQEGPSGFQYDWMEIIKAGLMEVTTETDPPRIEYIKNGAEIRLFSDENEEDSIHISATDILFFYPPDGGALERIELHGKVRLEGISGTMSAGKAEWDVATGAMIFTGDPVLHTPEISEARGSRMVYTPGVGFEIVNGAVAKAPLARGGSAQASGLSYLLRVEDVRDWPGLLTAVQAGPTVDVPTPGGRIMALLPPEVRDVLAVMPTAEVPSVNLQNDIIKQLNHVLQQPELYEAAAWRDIDVGPEAMALLERNPKALSVADVVKLNRLLLEAAYPDAIVQRAL